MLKNQAVSPDISYEKASSQSWVIWAVAALFYLYEMVLRVSPSVMVNQLMTDFSVTSTALGVLSSFYYYAYVPLQIPCGFIVDKFGTRMVITFSCLLCVIGTIIFSQSHNLVFAQLGRFLIGAGSACAFISCLKITADWFSPAKFALIASLTNMMGTLGGTLASSPLAILVNNTGWRKANIIMAFVGIGVMVLAWLTIRDNTDEIKRNQQRKVLNDLKILLWNKQIILSGIIGGLMYLPISAFSELWSVPFLMATYGISNEAAANANIMVFIGMALGGPVAVSLADRIKSYTKVMTLSTMATGALFVIIASAQFFPFYSMFFFLFLAGFCIGGQVLCFTCSLNNSEHDLSGSVVALTNALVMASGIVFQPLLGFILDFFWDGSVTAEGIRYYTQDCYQYSILALPLSLFASWYLLKFVRETYKQVHS